MAHVMSPHEIEQIHGHTNISFMLWRDDGSGNNWELMFYYIPDSILEIHKCTVEEYIDMCKLQSAKPQHPGQLVPHIRDYGKY